jgi:hypothetical protein
MPYVTCQARIFTGPAFQGLVGFPSPFVELSRCRMASPSHPFGSSSGDGVDKHGSIARQSCAWWPKPARGVPRVLNPDNHHDDFFAWISEFMGGEDRFDSVIF